MEEQDYNEEVYLSNLEDILPYEESVDLEYFSLTVADY